MSPDPSLPPPSRPQQPQSTFRLCEFTPPGTYIRRILQRLSFCAWCDSLSTGSSRFTHAVVGVRISLLFKAEEHSIVWIRHTYYLPTHWPPLGVLPPSALQSAGFVITTTERAALQRQDITARSTGRSGVESLNLPKLAVGLVSKGCRGASVSLKSKHTPWFPKFAGYPSALGTLLGNHAL